MANIDFIYPPMSPYEEMVMANATPREPPPTKSPPQTPSRNQPSPIRATPVRGPRPLPMTPDSSSPPPEFGSLHISPTRVRQPPSSPTRDAPPRTQPPQAPSYRSSKASTRSTSFDLEAFKWKALKDWEKPNILKQWERSNVKRQLDRHLESVKDRLRGTGQWSLRKKLIVFGSLAGLILILLIIIIAASLSSSGSESSSELTSSIHVTNSEAFDSGGASHESAADTHEGASSGKDKYTYYSGTAKNFPDSSKWIAFEDLWERNQELIKHSCSTLGHGQDAPKSEISMMHDGIQNTAKASLVDNRFILATILQESNGCLNVGGTRSSGGVTNPGLMQSHNGTSYDPSRPKFSIYKMIQDGTQGTQYGDGLVQLLNQYGNVYKAARGYNSGSIASNGDLSHANGATGCYVSDIANRLTGWVRAPSTCTGY